MAISKFWLDLFREMVSVEGVLVAFHSPTTIKEGTSHSDFQLNEPFSKFLQQRLRYEVPWPKGKRNNILYQHRSYLPPGHNLKPLPWGLLGSDLLKNIFSIWKSTTLNKMVISKFWLDVFREMVGVEGVLVAFQSLSTIKKGKSHSNFQLNEPFSKSLRQLFRYEVPCSKGKN